MHRNRWVVKAGSNMVCSGGLLLCRAWMEQAALLRRKHKIELIWVTSGAIASAVERGRFGKASARRTLAEKQALSAVGQPMVMDTYNLALQASGLSGAQVLLTYGDLASRERRRNFKNTMEQLLRWKVIPVLNENDAMATEEIRFGDNDSLSAKVAAAMGASRLIILTDVDGLYDADPRKDVRARLISNLPRVDARTLARVSDGAGSRHGTGGMLSKLLAAREASRHGIETWLVRGDFPDALLRIAKNGDVGTRIGPRR